MKKLFVFIAIVAIATSCQFKTETKTVTETVKIVPVEFTEFVKNITPYIDKNVQISGIVSHVCQHGGDKLFLVHNDIEERVKIVVGENMAAFSTDLEGLTLKVTGIVEELRIDEEYLKEWEAEIDAEEKEQHDHAHAEGEDHDHNGEHAHGEKGKAADQGQHIGDRESIADFRQQIAESGTDHIAFYSIVCEKYEIVSDEK